MPLPPTPPTSLAPLPRLPLPTPVSADVLLPKGLAVNDYIAAFMRGFGPGPELGPKVFTDVTGQQLVLDKELFWDRVDQQYKIQKRDREVFIRLLARTIAEPDEIWVRTEYHKAKGKDVIRRRYIGRFVIGDKTQPLIGVFEWGTDGWSGISTYQAEDEAAAKAMLVKDRIGTLIYSRA